MSCVAPGCKIGYGSSKLPPGVTKHVFPKDPARFEAWVKAVPRDNWRPAKTAVLCSLHFESTDFKQESSWEVRHKSGDTELKRRRLLETAVPSKFSVKDFERCCIASCNNASNTFAFPRLKKKEWTQIIRKYLNEPKWEPQPWTRICSAHFKKGHIIKTHNKPDRLDPRANPIIDRQKYPLVTRELPKPPPKQTTPMQSTSQPIFVSNKSVIVRHDLSTAKTFLLEKIKLEPDSTSSPSGGDESRSIYQHPYQQQQFLLQREQENFDARIKQATESAQLKEGEIELKQLRIDSHAKTSEPKRKFPGVVLMRARGNPNVFVQVDVQLWSPPDKMPTVPPPRKPAKDPAQEMARKKLGTVKDRKIRKLTNKVDRLQRKNERLQARLSDFVKTLSAIFEPDQLDFLDCRSETKHPSKWSEKTFAKAFDLRLNCGNQAYSYLLSKGFPLPSFKAMRRYILSIEKEFQETEVRDTTPATSSEVVFHRLEPQNYETQSLIVHPSSSTLHSISAVDKDINVYEVQHTLPVVMSSDLNYNGSVIEYQPQDGTVVDTSQQLFVIHSDNPQVAVLTGDEFKIQGNEYIRQVIDNRSLSPNAGIESGSKRKINSDEEKSSKRRKASSAKKDEDGPSWYLRLSEGVRQRIMFPKTNTEEESSPWRLPDLSDASEDSEPDGEKDPTTDTSQPNQGIQIIHMNN